MPSGRRVKAALRRVVRGGASTSLARARRIAALAGAVAVAVAGYVVIHGQQRDDGGGGARVDTELQAVIGGYKQRFPWSSDMVLALENEGLLTDPQRVAQLWAHFQMACVGGKDMLAGKPEATRSDLAEQFKIYATEDEARRLNAAQERMCAQMPRGGWSAKT
jgi:hypothetical protein